MKERENHGNVCILLCGCHQVEAVVFDVYEGRGVVLYDRRRAHFVLLFHDQRHELVDDGHVDVASVVPAYQHL